MRDASVSAIESSVGELLARRHRLVVALSGGADSAVLLDAIARLRTPDHHIVVAVVDHGTGPAATEATARSVAAAASLGLPAITERLQLQRHDENSLRRARWSFLRQVATAHDAPVATGHSWDDHVETVVMRILRGTSARGLAGLLAPSPVERPLLAHRREAIRAYAAARDVSFTEDPTNASLAYLRNRIRLQLLPAIRMVAPAFERGIFDLSRQAADLRSRVDAIAVQYLVEPNEQEQEAALLAFDAPRLAELPDPSLQLLLPALVATTGLALDRRGVMRLAQVVRSATGTRGQLSGGYEAVRSSNHVVITRTVEPVSDVLRLRVSGETIFGGFRFRVVPATSIVDSGEGQPSPWRISIPRTSQAVVRQWHHGDRLTTDSKGARRRVKRFFADAGIAGPLRRGWPVVVCGADVIWIPGIRASQAAIPRVGRMVHFTCERIRD